ncbi:MAG: CBS domain-containing protein [Pseudomonadota bacterium]|nr:CBS domain-containing protein [Pseudomonadota bacterium]
MPKNYKLLKNAILDTECTYQRPIQKMSSDVTLNSPATAVMTDLSKVAAMTINPCATIDQAEIKMRTSGVRALLVVNQYRHIVGIITARDVAGERATIYLHKVGGKREEILVQDLMTPQFKVDVLELDHVREAKVGNMVETLKTMGRQHALVVDRGENGKMLVCGVFSTTQIARQLGIEINTADVAGSIADLSAAKG